jgi:hypothetical protein
MGKRKPVTLVRAVVARKNAVHLPRPAFENNPPTTVKPANIDHADHDVQTVNCSRVNSKVMVQLPSPIADRRLSDAASVAGRAAHFNLDLTPTPRATITTRRRRRMPTSGAFLLHVRPRCSKAESKKIS